MILDHADKPGVRDRANFSLHWSVDYWQNFTLPPAIEDSGNAPIPSRHASLAEPVHALQCMPSTRLCHVRAYRGHSACCMRGAHVLH